MTKRIYSIKEKELIEIIKNQFKLDINSIHGILH